MKIAINKCYGGFGLSPIAVQEYLRLRGKDCFYYQADYGQKIWKKVSIEEADSYDTSVTKDLGDVVTDENHLYSDEHRFYYMDIERNDPFLIQAIEAIGEGKSSGQLSNITIVEIPDDVDWYIDYYDGIESIHETHRSW
jgi:hypothetical protein